MPPPGGGGMPCPRRGDCRCPPTGAKGGKGTVWFPCPLLTPPNPPLRRDSLRSRGETGVRGLGSGRLSAYGTLYRPEFTLRKPPRMTVRGHPVQGVRTPLRKAPLPSSVYPWSTKRPCGPLAFRRATGGSRVQRRVWGVKRGKGTIGALSPLVSAARRRHSHALRGRKVAYSGAPLYRRKVDRLLTVKRKGSYCLQQQLSLRIKQKHRLKVDAFTFGAADEARTRYHTPQKLRFHGGPDLGLNEGGGSECASHKNKGTD